jgi:hypothetical protein
MDGAGEIVTRYLKLCLFKPKHSDAITAMQYKLITLLSTIVNHWSQGIKRVGNIRFFNLITHKKVRNISLTRSRINNWRKQRKQIYALYLRDYFL